MGHGLWEWFLLVVPWLALALSLHQFFAFGYGAEWREKRRRRRANRIYTEMLRRDEGRDDHHTD